MSAKDAPIQRLIREKREEIVTIANRHGASNVRLVGSVARGDEGPESDVDLLIDVGPETTPWFPGGLIGDLQDLLGRKVDVLFERSLPAVLRPYVLPDALPLDRPLPRIRRRRTRMKKDDRVYLEYIREAGEDVRGFTGGSRESLLSSRLVREATLHRLQTLAESCQKLSAELKGRHPGIDWLGIRDFRNRIVHGYMDVDLDKVWAIIEDDLPRLLAIVVTELEDR